MMSGKEEQVVTKVSGKVNWCVLSKKKNARKVTSVGLSNRHGHQTDLCFMSSLRCGMSNKVSTSFHRRESDTYVRDNSHSSNILFPYDENLLLKPWSASLSPARLNELTT